MSSHQRKPKNNDRVSLPKTVTSGKDGNGLKLEKNCPFVTNSEAVTCTVAYGLFALKKTNTRESVSSGYPTFRISSKKNPLRVVFSNSPLGVSSILGVGYPDKTLFLIIVFVFHYLKNKKFSELKPARDAHSCHITNIEPLAR